MGKQSIRSKHVLVDSDILIDAFEEKEEAILLLENIGRDRIFISSITYMELCRGARNKNELQEIMHKLKGYKILNFTPEVSLAAMQYIEDYHLSHGLQIPDAIIGASAVILNLKLFTNNKKHFRFIPGILLYE